MKLVWLGGESKGFKSEYRIFIVIFNLKVINLCFFKDELKFKVGMARIWDLVR